LREFTDVPLQDGDEIRVGPHRLVFDLLAPRGITETLAKLEQSETEVPSILKGEVAAPPVAGRRRKAVEAPAAEPEEQEDDPVAGQAAAWLKRESERTPEPAPTHRDATCLLTPQATDGKPEA
jgi:hypothetical protein